MTGAARLVADWPCYWHAVRAGQAGAELATRPYDGMQWWEWHADRGELAEALRHLPTAPRAAVRRAVAQ